MAQPASGSHVRLVVNGSRGPILSADFRGARTQQDFVDLLGGLTHGWALYELTPFGLQGEPIPTPTIAGYAAAYCQEIEARLDGPFHVAGYCQGSLLAYAVAARLQALGHEVPLLVLVDAQPSGARALAAEFRRLVQGLTGALPPAADEALATARALLTDDPRAALAALSAALRSAMEPMVASGGDYTAALYGELVGRYEAWLAYLTAAANFQPERYRGTMHLFVAGSGDRADTAWRPYGDVVAHEFNAPHDRLLGDPGLRAAFLRLLDDAGGAEPA